MNPPLGVYPPLRIVVGFMSSLPATLPRVLPADMSIAFGSFISLGGIHPRGLDGVVPPQCAFSRAFM